LTFGDDDSQILADLQTSSQMNKEHKISNKFWVIIIISSCAMLILGVKSKTFKNCQKLLLSQTFRIQYW